MYIYTHICIIYIYIYTCMCVHIAICLPGATPARLVHVTCVCFLLYLLVRLFDVVDLLMLCCFLIYGLHYDQTANEDPRKYEFESKRILNVEGGLS